MTRPEQREWMKSAGYRYDIARRWYVHELWDESEPNYLPPPPWGITEQQVFETLT